MPLDLRFSLRTMFLAVTVAALLSAAMRWWPLYIVVLIASVIVTRFVAEPLLRLYPIDPNTSPTKRVLCAVYCGALLRWLSFFGLGVLIAAVVTEFVNRGGGGEKRRMPARRASGRICANPGRAVTVCASTTMPPAGQVFPAVENLGRTGGTTAASGGNEAHG